MTAPASALQLSSSVLEREESDNTDCECAKTGDRRSMRDGTAILRDDRIGSHAFTAASLGDGGVLLVELKDNWSSYNGRICIILRRGDYSVRLARLSVGDCRGGTGPVLVVGGELREAREEDAIGGIRGGPVAEGNFDFRTEGNVIALESSTGKGLEGRGRAVRARFEEGYK